MSTVLAREAPDLRKPVHEVAAQAEEGLRTQRGPTCAPRFAINGRFLSQRVTGVQRYAIEVTNCLDRLLLNRNETAVIVSPQAQKTPTARMAISTEVSLPFQGHLWEQTTLPRRRRTPILNLCNTAPILAQRNVVCIHDANVFTAPTSYSARFRTFYRALQPLIAKRALRVTTVSNHAAKEISYHLGLRLGSIEVLPNGHEHAVRWSPAQSRFNHMAHRTRPYVLLIGSLAKHKNIGRVIGLASRLNELGLDIVVAGAGHKIFASTLRADAPNIEWVARPSDDDLAYLLKGALCLAFPSTNEGFGLPLVEAMAVGCPVVASRASCMPEICGNGALLADPQRDDEWLAHLQRLANSRDLRADLIGRGRERARHFQWSVTAAAYLDIMCQA